MKLNINLKPSFSLNKILSRLPEFVLLLSFFMLLTIISHGAWWIVKPSSSNYLTQSNTIQTSDNLSQQLVNLAPFGTVKVEIESKETIEKPKDKIIVYGVYASNAENSIALVKINDKEDVVKIGDSLAGGIVSKILSNKIIITINDKETTFNVSANPDQEQSEFANRPTTTDNSNSSNTTEDTKSKSHDPEINNLAEQRRKMIKQFQDDNGSSTTEHNKINSSN